ncbi:MAG: hypothetical protein ACI959_000297 [Limisphaerales bacterium]|jgi:hypothetical protein
MSTEIIDGDLNSDGLSITPAIQTFLRETAKWAKFISILGFIGLGLMIVAAIAMATVLGSLMQSEMGAMGAMGGGAFSVVYILIALLYFFPILYLYRFASKMQRALDGNDQTFLLESFESLKSHYKFIGILAAIFMAFYALAFIIGILGSL